MVDRLHSLAIKSKKSDLKEVAMENRKEKNGKKWLILLILLLLLIIIGLLVGILLRGGNQAPANSNGVFIDQSAGKYTEKQETSDGSQIKGVVIPGWSTLTFPAGTKEVDTVDFYNPEGNADSFYLTFQILIPDDKGGYESIYQSGLVEPGLHIQTIELTRELEAGTYEAILHVQPYTMDESRTATNNADLKTTLVVE